MRSKPGSVTAMLLALASIGSSRPIRHLASWPAPIRNPPTRHNLCAAVLGEEWEMAATDFWNGTGSWSTDDAAWSDNSPPISTENAQIQTGTANLTSTTTTPIAAL